MGDNPRGWERGLQTVTRTASDAWLNGLPAHFSAWLSHRQSVLAPPPQATVLARSALDACQVLRYSPQAFSVQFHPEFSREIMTACTPADVQPDSAVMGDTDWARTLLQRFWQQVRPRDQEASQR